MSFSFFVRKITDIALEDYTDVGPYITISSFMFNSFSYDSFDYYVNHYMDENL